MILRRFMKHVTDQNWFAVGLDVIVVIVGIFLGLQVQAWYEEQDDRKREDFYLHRLHEEVIERTEAFQINFVSRKLSQEKLFEVLEYFAGNYELSKLTPLHCYAIFAAHIFNTRLVSMPTITELISSGQLHIIENDELRFSFSKYELGINELQTLVSGISASQMVFSRDYPEYIILDPNMRSIQAYSEFNHECDFEGIKLSNGARNSIIDNSARLNSFVAYSNKLSHILSELHNILDKELEVTHAGQ